jgi:hypothetical protein
MALPRFGGYDELLRLNVLNRCQMAEGQDRRPLPVLSGLNTDIWGSGGTVHPPSLSNQIPGARFAVLGATGGAVWQFLE